MEAFRQLSIDFPINALVRRVDAPGKRGRVCAAPCPKTHRIKVQWGSRSTWVAPEKLVKVNVSVEGSDV